MRMQRPILGCVSILITVVAGLGCGDKQVIADRPDVPGVVIAREFRLVDAHDKTRISLCMMHGSPSVILYAEDGKRPAVLIASDGQMSTVSLLGESGEAYVSMSIEHQEYRGVVLRDDEGNSWVGMGLSQDNVAYMGVENPNGTKSIRISLEEAEPLIKAEDKDNDVSWHAP